MRQARLLLIVIAHKHISETRRIVTGAITRACAYARLSLRLRLHLVLYDRGNYVLIDGLGERKTKLESEKRIKSYESIEGTVILSIYSDYSL